MENGKQLISPIFDEKGHLSFVNNGLAIGLTKREYFAGLAMQGFLIKIHPFEVTEQELDFIAEKSTELSDSLLKALEEPNEQ